MSAVRSISITNDESHVPFTLEAAGLAERPIVTHTCTSCHSTSVLTAADGREVAAWLIGECVDDAQGNGVLMPEGVRPCRHCKVPVRRNTQDGEDACYDVAGGTNCADGRAHG